MATRSHRIESDGARIVRRYVDEFLGGGDVAVATDLAHEDIRVHQLGADTERIGRALNVKQVLRFRESVPDYTLTVEELFEGSDTVTVRATARGTPKQPWEGLVPTGRSFAVPSMHVFRLEQGRIVEHWMLTDRLGIGQQLGLMPPTPRALVAVVRNRLRRFLFGRRRRA